MPTVMRLPVRIGIGKGEPVEVGTVEMTMDEAARPELARQGFAQVLRAATEEIEPDPVKAEVYRERARLVAFVAAQYPSVLAYADPEEPEWAVVYVASPAGQLSWHIAPDDVELFEHVPKVTPDDPRAEWDGHTTEEKYERLAALIRGGG